MSLDKIKRLNEMALNAYTSISVLGVELENSRDDFDLKDYTILNNVNRYRRALKELRMIHDYFGSELEKLVPPAPIFHPSDHQ